MVAQIQVPEQDGFYKVTQLYVQTEGQRKPVLAFSDYRERHSALLAQALAKEGITDFEIIEVMPDVRGPALKGQRYETVGMGVCSKRGRILSFAGDSLDYRLKISEQHLEDCKSSLEGFKIQVSKNL